MAEYHVILSKEAKLDIERIYQHYLNNADMLVADKLLGQLEQAVISLEEQPLRGHTPKELQGMGLNCLELLTKSFRLIYRIEKNQVLILIVLHQRQSVQKALANRLLH